MMWFLQSCLLDTMSACYKCNRRGHYARECDQVDDSPRGSGRRDDGGRDKCYKCNGFGHFARECKEEQVCPTLSFFYTYHSNLQQPPLGIQTFRATNGKVPVVGELNLFSRFCRTIATAATALATSPVTVTRARATLCATTATSRGTFQETAPTPAAVGAATAAAGPRFRATTATRLDTWPATAQSPRKHATSAAGAVT